MNEETRQCIECCLYKPVSEFYRCPSRNGNCSSRCKQCTTKMASARYYADPEHQNEVRRKRRRKYKDAGLCSECGKNKPYIKSLCKTCVINSDTRKEYRIHVEPCVICGFEYADVHHKDGDRKNNAPENLVSLCPNHHRLVTYGILEIKQPPV